MMKFSKSILLATLASLVSVSARANFAEYVMPIFERGELIVPEHMRAYDNPPEKLDAKADAKLIKLYTAHLPKREGGYIFVADDLMPENQLPTVHPVSAYYNTHLIFAETPKGEKVAVFRPVDTTTGCHTGCNPVVFHLKMDLKGRVEEIIEEAGRPLNKIYHQPFTDADRKKALELAQKLPQGLRNIDSPTRLADESTHFPPQTWTVFKPFFVEGAAYTSYRIYEAALKSSIALKPEDKKAPPSMLPADDELISNLLSIEDPKTVPAKLDEILKYLDNRTASNDLRTVVLNLSPFLVAWMNEKGVDAVPAATKLFARKEYHNERIQTYCDFLGGLVENERGAKLLVTLLDKGSKLPKCPQERVAVYELLAATQLRDKARADKAAKQWDFTKVPSLVVHRPALFGDYIEAAKLTGHTKEADRLVAEYQVRLPKAALPSGVKPASKELIKSAEQDYRNELKRLLLPTPRALPNLTVESQKGKSQNLASLTRQKPILVFVAMWCPHCQATVKRWVEAKWKPATWNKIQFIRIFTNRGQDDVQGFCKITGLNKAKCASIMKFKGDDEYNAGMSLGLVSVPRIMVSDGKGKIAVADYPAEGFDGQDVERDLNWIVEEAKR